MPDAPQLLPPGCITEGATMPQQGSFQPFRLDCRDKVKPARFKLVASGSKKRRVLAEATSQRWRALIFATP